MRDVEQTAALLAWYDEHAREMPWRVGPDARRAEVRPDPYRVWLSEVMLQQTTVAAVRAYFLRFTLRWPTVQDLAAAQDADVMAEWAGLGYYARARNLLKCARVVADELGGVFPRDQAGLMALPGIGPYTSAAIAAIAFDQPAVVVDGNVERVMARIYAVQAPLPGSKPALTALAARLTPVRRPGDYAQAVMDLGATVCTPKSPDCGVCPWAAPCQARAKGLQAELPRKVAKKPKPTRLGYAYLARRNDGAWLLERRPDRGLLGGMLGWPGAEWGDVAVEAPPFAATWRNMGEVKHTFTHFHLQLQVMVAAAAGENPQTGHFVTQERFDAGDLPTVMRKAFDLAHSKAAEWQPG
ncbi:A/G-specific adenine glycosylase [Candidatus Halocynthiibacter alkanivorans]|uniref:A/G-specific adenine glycosylase n=1 Tax=Candidatus Halocynthiibacter alkanivorans TaxID=2267619 RepID=UPI000DF2850D|nr:A/G-specific adenine glycosylase [Candidatus Halocynthiibacter alkanivorans]